MSYIENVIGQMAKKRVVLWGAGRRVGGFIRKYCADRRALPIPSFVCDSTREVAEGEIAGVPVLPFAELKELDPADTIIVITAGLLELQAQVVKNELYYYPLYHCRSFETYFYLRENQEAYQRAVELLHDEHSRRVYRSCLDNIQNGVLWDQSLYESSPYFGNELIPRLTDDGRVVFAGAFNGKHIDRMLRNNPRVTVDAFEPSRHWHRFLSDRFASNPAIRVHNKVLWEGPGRQSFQDDMSNAGLDARVCGPNERGTYEIECVNIDALEGGKTGQIILDVEASEQMVLRGAASTIRRDRPILTVCLYHTTDDFVRIPALIDRLSEGGYRMHVKQHSCISAIETVLYALPR